MKPQVSQALEEELASRGVAADKRISKRLFGPHYFDYDLVKGRKSLGGLTVQETTGNTKSECQAAFQGLAGPTALSYVVESEVAAEHRGKGFGSLVYRVALEDLASHGHALAPGTCMGQPTSGEAMLVWDALSKRYPSRPYHYGLDDLDDGEEAGLGYVVFGRRK